MKRLYAAFAAGALVLIAQSTSGKSDAPVISRPKKADAKLLATGRSLFVTRCIECHSLPRPKEYAPAQWPGLVNKMARRADLTPADQKAVTAYILALRQK